MSDIVGIHRSFGRFTEILV